MSTAFLNLSKVSAAFRLFRIRNTTYSVIKPRIPSSYKLYTAAGVSGLIFSSLYMNQKHAAIVYAKDKDSILEISESERIGHFHLLSTLQDLAPKINAKKMLKLFLIEFNQEGHDHVTKEFVIELFEKCGIEDKDVAIHLFELVCFAFFPNIPLFRVL